MTKNECCTFIHISQFGKSVKNFLKSIRPVSEHDPNADQKQEKCRKAPFCQPLCREYDFHFRFFCFFQDLALFLANLVGEGRVLLDLLLRCNWRILVSALDSFIGGDFNCWLGDLSVDCFLNLILLLFFVLFSLALGIFFFEEHASPRWNFFPPFFPSLLFGLFTLLLIFLPSLNFVIYGLLGQTFFI